MTPSAASSGTQPVASSEYSQRRKGEAASAASNSRFGAAPLRRTCADGDNRRRVVDHHRGAGQFRFARGGRRIDFAVGGHHAEIILAVGQHIAVEGESAVMQVALEQHPAALVVGAEIEVIDQAVAIGIFGLPTDGDLLRGGAG